MGWVVAPRQSRHLMCPQNRSLKTSVETPAKTVSVLIYVEGALSRVRCAFDGRFDPETRRYSRRVITASFDPGCVETFVLFLCGGLVGAVARSAHNIGNCVQIGCRAPRIWI